MHNVIVIGTIDLFEMAETSLNPESYRIIGYLAPKCNTHSIYSKYCYLGGDDIIETGAFADARFLVALYNNKRRRAIVESIERQKRPLLSVVHPSSVVMPSASRGLGATVAFLCTISSCACLGKAVVVRSHAHIAHEVTIGDYSFIAPGVRLLGGARIGTGVLVGANAVVFPNVTIGDWAKIGANAVVRKNVPATATFVGE